ncbi:MAG: hypothetical protein QM718_05065 [Steroidobacteraceae bacterium]
MRTASLMILAGTLLLSMGGAEAQTAATQSCPPYTNGKSLDTARLFDSIDADHDGKLTHEEWVQAGAPETTWQRLLQFPKVQKQGYVTRADFQSDSLPHGVDVNCNGVLTLQELADYERMAAAAAPVAKPGRKPVLPAEPNGASSSAGSGGIPGAGASGAAGAGAPGVPGTAPPVQ